METQLHLVEAKLLRNTRNRRFRTITVDPADRLALIGQCRWQADFAMIEPSARRMPRSTAKQTAKAGDARSLEFGSQ